MKIKTSLLAIGAIFSLSACARGQSTSEMYSVGFDYNNFQIECNHIEVQPNDLLRRVLPNLLELVSRDEELRITLDVLDYTKPNLVGYKQNGSHQLVQFLFATYKRTDIMSPGEGGVNVVVDPCEKSIVYANFFRFP